MSVCSEVGAIETQIKEAKARKRRVAMPVIGDMSAMLDSLPTFDLLLDRATVQSRLHQQSVPVLVGCDMHHSLGNGHSYYKFEEPIKEMLYGAKNGVYVFGYNSKAQKVNRFGWNLEHCAHIVGGWTWQIFGAIRTVATVWEAAKILFFLGQVNSTRFHRFPIGRILWHLNTTTLIGEAMKRSEQDFEHFIIRCRFSTKTQKLFTKFQGVAISGRHNTATITDRRNFIAKLTLYQMSIFWHIRSVQDRYLPKFLAVSDIVY